LLDESRDRVYVAQTGLIGGANGVAYATHKTPMAFSGERDLKEGKDALSVRFESADVGGLKLVKTYTLHRASYDIKVKHEVINTGAAAVSPQLYVQLVRDGNKPAGESAFYSTFTGPAIYTEAKKYNKIVNCWLVEMGYWVENTFLSRSLVLANGSFLIFFSSMAIWVKIP
jgi:YidC/Oxa1 family membrane protein insertase